MRKITLSQARRFALAAQGLADPRPPGRVDVRHFRRVMDRVGLVQLDSVNVFARAHYMPFFARLGPYDRDSLDRWLWGSGEVFEYWGHEASLLPTEHHRLMRWRMEDEPYWGRLTRFEEEFPDYVQSVYEEVAARGPLQVRDLPDPGNSQPNTMWGWAKGKVALEALFSRGRVTTAARPNFTRRYDITERVIPAEYLNSPALPIEEARAELVLKAARSLGVATADDLADYYRIKVSQARPLIDRLIGKGELVEVGVEGWSKPAYLHPEAKLPRRVEGAALVSPFDSLIWFRPRVERLWGFRYRIEIYVPAEKRVYGYYVLPFLMDGKLVARVDLKSDRKAGVLRVKGAFPEPGVDKVAVGRALRSELEQVAAWLKLADVDFPNVLCGSLGLNGP
ncbi:MAG: winged helix-turn-helix domain-containing protein [Acidimicrobiia bacterium]